MKKGLILLSALGLVGCSQEAPLNIALVKKSSVPLPRKTPKVTQQEKRSFRDFKIWADDSGQKFRIILIPHSRLTKRDMRALGEELKNEDDRDGKYLFTFVYDNAKAAGMDGKKYPEELTDKEVDFYLKHKVGEFGKNPSTGYRALRIYYDGFVGVDSEEIIYNKANS